MKRIKCAVIKHDGKVYGGDDHAAIVLYMARSGVSFDTMYKNKYGFMADDGTLVGRRDAMAIAINSGQVSCCMSSDELMSYDLIGE